MVPELYPIIIEHDNEKLHFMIQSLHIDNELQYEIWKEGVMYFKLQICPEGDSDGLKLSHEFHSAGVHPELASKVADVIMSMNE